MMTERLYYADSYLKEFSATVVACRRSGDEPAVVLDRTAFYPESGGQRCDTGMLNDAHVLRVVEEDGGTILHVLDREIAEGLVAGRIDWARRFDHMQQHTGQHILSQAFLGIARAQTLSFHMGADASTIDVDLAQLTPQLLASAERLAADVVFRNRPVHVLETDRENLGSLGIRKESRREGRLRVIDVDGFDRSACGGTHVGATGEIGVIFVSDHERYKGGTRVEFVAGVRALRLLQKDHELLRQLSRIYSAAPEKLAETAEKMMQERAALAREKELIQDRLLDHEAAELLRCAPQSSGRRAVSMVCPDRTLDGIKALAQKLTAHPGTVAVLGLPDACQIVVARSKDVDGHCGDAVKKVAVEMGGKGGGRPEFAQAGGFPPERLQAWMQALEAFFRT